MFIARCAWLQHPGARAAYRNCRDANSSARIWSASFNVRHPSGSIEHIVQQALGELGFAEPVFQRHAFLLRDQQVVGRRFCFDGVEAVWLTAEGRIKLFGEEGECLRVVDVGDDQGRKAA